MSTNNFGFTNILYTVNSFYYTDQETGQECQDEFIRSDTISNIKYELKGKADWSVWDKPQYYHRGYNSGYTIIAQASEYFQAKGLYSSILGYTNTETDLSISLTTESGYYDGFSFDYIINFDSEEFTQKEWDTKMLDPMLNFAMTRTEARKADAFIKRNVKALCKVLAHFTDETAKIAQLSDGSAIYSIL